MTLALAALVLATLQPSSVVSASVTAQKIQVIKGGARKAKAVTPKDSNELAPQTIQDRSQPAPKADDAAARDVADKERALDEKQKAQAEADKKQAERQRALQKKLEKLGDDNEKAYGGAADALAGD